MAEQQRDGWMSVVPDDPLAPGSEEANHLRHHARYMLEQGGLKTLVGNILWRAFWTLVFIFGLATGLGLAGGLVARVVGIVDYDPARRHFSGPSASGVALLVACGAVLCVALVVRGRSGLRQAFRAAQATDRELRLLENFGYFAVAVALLGAARVVGPHIWEVVGSADGRSIGVVLIAAGLL